MIRLTLSVVLFIVCCSAAAEETLEDRLKYLEFEIDTESENFNKGLFEVQKLIKRLKDKASIVNSDGDDDDSEDIAKMMEEAEEMKERIITYWEDKREKHLELSGRFREIKKDLHEKAVKLDAMKNTKTKINEMMNELAGVSKRIKHEEVTRTEMKRELDKLRMPSVIEVLDEQVEILEDKLGTASEEMREYSANLSAVYVPCENGWTWIGRKCYLYTPENTLNWYEAVHSCTEKGGKLAEPESGDEMMAVLGIVGRNVWLGGTDSTIEGIWVWASTQNLADGIVWEDGQPNDRNGKQDCLEINLNALNDEDCTEEHEYICEKMISVDVED